MTHYRLLRLPQPYLGGFFLFFFSRGASKCLQDKDLRSSAILYNGHGGITDRMYCQVFGQPCGRGASSLLACIKSLILDVLSVLVILKPHVWFFL